MLQNIKPIAALDKNNLRKYKIQVFNNDFIY